MTEKPASETTNKAAVDMAKKWLDYFFHQGGLSFHCMTSYTCETHPHSIRLSIDDFRHTYHFVDFDNYLKTNDTRVTATRMGTILDNLGQLCK